MPFNTYTFLVFFITLLVIHNLIKSWRLQKLNLLAASYLFYSAWNPLFVFLLMASTLIDWVLAKRIFKADTAASKKKYLIASLSVNLGILGYFKYGNFLLENSIALLKLAGINFQPIPLNLILPVGISFYTFQTLSYTIDIFRGKIKPSNSFIDYALYVSFFPQLVAGPIVRANDFLPQCQNPRKADENQFGWGLSLLTIGLFMKIMIADTLLAPVAEKVYGSPEQFSCLDTWTAVFAFSGQIFCDFAGYSTAAIGVALCFGFILPDNFKAPYAALGFRDFWRRWHISLSSWLQDYLYISLGGNRISAVRTQINLMATMLIGGLWHGASWLFVIWGGLHGLYLMAEHRITKNRIHYSEMKGPIRFIISIMTFLIVSLTWVFFRSKSMTGAMTVFSNLLTPSAVNPKLTDIEIITVLLTSLSVLMWQIYRRDSSLESYFSNRSPIERGGLLLFMIILIFLFGGGDDRAFIYFQF